MRGRWAGVCAIAVVLLLAGAAAWQWWPRQVAPGLTPQMVKIIDSSSLKITLLDGGSRRDAHTLWTRYHHRTAFGTPPKSPRLLGISLARVESEGSPRSGTYWVIYSDRVWSCPLGGPGKCSWAREVDFVDSGSLRVDSSMVF